MSQVLVNFRLDEEDKRGMEAVCHELGMSMSTAFTIFACYQPKDEPFEGVNYLYIMTHEGYKQLAS